MRAHHTCVLFVTMVAAVVGGTRVAEAAPFVNRPLTLSRSDVALDLGLGMAHVRGEPDDTNGFGLNFEVAGGLTSSLQLGLRTGVRIGRDGRATGADYYGRTFETETYGTAGGTVANPEISLRWKLVDSTVELGLEGRLYLPIRGDLGIMVGVPVAIHLGSVVRLDTGLFVPIIFTEPEASTLVSIPFHLWIQASHEVFLGLITGVRFHDPGTSVPLGIALGYSASYDVDLKTWLLFPDVDDNDRNFGIGGGLQVRF